MSVVPTSGSAVVLIYHLDGFLSQERGRGNGHFLAAAANGHAAVHKGKEPHSSRIFKVLDFLPPAGIAQRQKLLEVGNA